MNKKVILTCYDAAFARICADTESLDYLLVGDSMGMVLDGASSTVEVSLNDMIRHARAVARGISKSQASKKPQLIVDMPASTYRHADEALDTARRLAEAGAQILKLEGPVIDQVRALRSQDFRVCGHIGLTPQSIHNYKVQGRSDEDAERLRQEAKQLEAAGCELLVLEMIPAVLARQITDFLKIPCIGIGAGPYCDGQVLVLYDVLGFDPDFNPKFLKKFFNAHEVLGGAIKTYAEEVRVQKFPSSENSF
jgi:3-methyl-2-oxobutanoate hydroxymethyltransferase